MDGHTLLGRADLDGEHEQLFAHLALLEAAGDAELGALLARFATEARAHFAHEDALMAGADFPTRDCHLQEHADVLASLGAVHRLVEEGDLAVGRRVVRELVRWLPEHIAALDHALAQWLFRRASGGARVVLQPRRAGGAGGTGLPAPASERATA